MKKKKDDCPDRLARTLNELARERDRADQLQNLNDHDSETGLLRHHMLIRRVNRMISAGRSAGLHSTESLENAEPSGTDEKSGLAGNVMAAVSTLSSEHHTESADGEPLRFAYGIIRLDRNYQRIRHSRDRLKVLLYVTAERIKSVIGEGNLYQSDRSDEFLFIKPLNREDPGINEIVVQMMDAVREFHNPPASDISFGCNVGVAIYPDHASDVNELEENAEIALGVHEEVRWGGFLYSPEIGATYHENNSLESILRSGILDGFSGFHVAYQPLVDLSRSIIGCEALMRWDAPGHGSISPTRFIPLAEKSGPILYLGKWILYQVLGQVKVWRETLSPSLFASVNMSLVQLEQPDCVEMISTAMESHRLPGEAIQIEVTESALMENPEAVRSNLQAFQQMGIRIMLDDFGTGYSSLAVLNTLPVNTLKIAKEIIDDFPTDPRSVEIVRAIMGISETFGFTTLAEGIEREDQYTGLMEHGCDVLQGFLFSEPVNAPTFQELFRGGIS